MQPGLLEERRSWVRKDREVKLDIFLSLAEEVMLELFEVGPPLPPSNFSSQEILEALDERFNVFSFSGYHHAFCHFLNLHIDQYASIEDFNNEFTTVLEDLIDYGHPLSNTQACSAYFSKLRCTQNPWVAKKLEDWDMLPAMPDIYNLMQESPPWACIRPLRSQKVAVHASDKNIEPDPQDLREAIEKLLTSAEAKHSSLKTDAPVASVCATPDWLNVPQKVAPKILSTPELPPPVISLPLRKTPTQSRTSESSWCYTKDNSEDTQGHSIPILTSSIFLQGRNPDIANEQSKTSLQSSAADITALPSFTSNIDDLIPPLPKRNMLRKASSSIDILKRLSGDSLLESSDEVREREEKKVREKERKRKGWTIGVNIARFTYSKGIQ
ncbi:unnamed protein product [Alternaria alternata]